MVYGNLLSLSLYTGIILIVSIIVGSPTLIIISIINIIILIAQYNKQNKSKKEVEEIKQEEIKNVDLKEQAKINIEQKYQNEEIDDKTKENLIFKEYIELIKKEKN